jgi:muramidase (phage lysozyme)
MATRNIEAFKLRTELIVDATKAHSEYQKAEGYVKKYGDQVVKTGKEASKAFDGQAVGKKWGSDFGSSAVASITGSIGSLGQTLGALIGTGIAPGIGTAIGSTIGSGIDTALQKVSGPILEQITHGIELNKLLERSKVHFTTFIGNEAEAVAHLEQLKKLSGDTGLRMGVLVEGSQRLEEFTGKLDLTRLFMRAAADQSALFYGDATKGFDSMADALGRIMLRGEDVGKLMKQLEGQGVQWKKYLAEGLGLTEKQVAALVKAGRIRGEGIATLVAQGIERHAGGFAQTVGTVGPGVEQRVGALMEIRAAEGTQRITGGIGDMYTKFAELLASPQAKQIVDFLDKMGGYVVDFTEKAVKTGVSVGGNIAEGLMSFSPATMMQSFTKLGDFVESGLKTVFEIKSPSGRTAREIGEPLGEGLGVGMVRKFQGYLEGKGKDEIVATLEQLLKDPRIKAFLDTIQWAEGGAPNRIVGGKTFSDLSRHPNIVGLRTAKGPSTAAGSYQITGTNDRRLSAQLGLQSFDAHSQALKALAIIAGHPGGLQALMSGDIKNLERFARLDWTSTPGSQIGGGGQKSEQSWMSHFNQFVGGKAVDASNPMPVYVVRDIEGGAAMLNRQGSQGPVASLSLMGQFAQFVQQQDTRTVQLGEEDAAIVTVIDANKELISTTGLTADQIAGISVKMRPLVPLIADVSNTARAAYATNADVQKLNRQLYIENASLGQEIVGAFQQISGMIPGQQTVGKKRGFFSKLLGFAAPFLSFIPGVGPLLGAALSTIAGAAGNALGGNYGAAVSGIAGGFATGGSLQAKFFPGTGAGPAPAHAAQPHRAIGGPGYRGRVYWTGEHGPEPFVAPANGQFLSHRDAMSAMGGGLHPEVMALLERMHATLNRFDSMPADHVVMKGARGLMKAMDGNAGISEQMGRRLRLA